MRNIDAIFIQPTYGCALNCSGCYVKESIQNGQMPKRIFKEFLEYIYSSGRVNVGQVTVAVDNLPEGFSDKEKRDYGIMLETYKSAIELKRESGSKTELHLTVNSYPAYVKYLRKVGVSNQPHNSPSPVNLVSYSHIAPKFVEIFERSYKKYEEGDPQINYNYMPDGKWDNYAEALKFVHMSYFVLHKPGLGNRLDPMQVQLYKEGLRFVDTLPRELKKKVIVDSCVTDSHDFLSTGYGCSANIRKIHVWPDGHVSGCPYNKGGE
jgi:MoaA/NifB/PqqE/SkfB family radical SAM enzyme